MLLHELAHIKRGDYFINIAQHFTEILFFFNPGVLWISSLIREERENCCDDIAVRHTGSKKEFIHALVSFQEFHNTGWQPAMAFAGTRDHLLQRVKRIVYHDNKMLDMREKFFLLGCLLVTVALSLAFSSLPLPAASAAAKNGNLPVVAGEPILKKNTAIFPPAETLTRDLKNAGAGRQGTAALDSVPGQEEKKEKIRRQREELMERQKKLAEEQDRLREEQEKLEEEEMKISGADRAILMEKMKRIEQDIRAREDRGDMTDKEKILAEDSRMSLEKQLKELGEADRRNLKDLPVELEEARRNTEKSLAMMQKKLEFAKDADKRALKEQLKTLEADQSRMSEDQSRMSEDRARMGEDQLKEKENAARMESQQKILMLNRKAMEINRQKMEENRQRMEMDRAVREEKMNLLKEKTLNPIVADLYDKHIITDKENFSISLTDSELTVNGVKQPDAVFHAIREKYAATLENDLGYSKKDGSESISINRRK